MVGTEGAGADPHAGWLAVLHEACDAAVSVITGAPADASRREETGVRGEGGDRTLVLDEAAETAILGVLEAHRDRGASSSVGAAGFSVLTEERGLLRYGSDDVLVVADPIDGSLNMKRSLPHHAVSLAVAFGPDVAHVGTIADVAVALVHDVGPDERFTAIAGRGAHLDGRALARDVPERTTRDGRLEVLCVESADPRHLLAVGEPLGEAAHRLRAIGATAISLAQVAAARADAMLTFHGCRSVDAAASQLLVRETGGVVAYPSAPAPLAAPLDLESHYAICAARTDAGLERVASLRLKR